MTYLKAIGMSEILCKRVETIHEFYRQLCPEDITGIFVTDYVREDGTREYENLWFFAGPYWMEAHDFVTKDEFDMVKARVSSWLVKKQDYDFQRATEKSRLQIDYGCEGEVQGRLKAAKENCDYLREILVKRIIPKVAEYLPESR